MELPQSQLPQEPEYWDRFARRISRDAAAPLATYARANQVWYGVLSHRAPWLVAASAAAMLVLWVTLPARESLVADRWIERFLSPDELAGSLIGGPAPPSVDALLAQFPPPEEGRGP